MKKLSLLLIIIFIVSISFVVAVNYNTLPQLYRLDRVISLNQSGSNISMDCIILDGVKLCDLSKIGNTTQEIWVVIDNGTFAYNDSLRWKDTSDGIIYSDGNVSISNITFIGNKNGKLITLNPTQINEFIRINTGAGISEKCYQEFANVSTACGGLSTGNYYLDNFFAVFPPSNAVDGDYTTLVLAPAGQIANLYANYTIPTTHLGEILWQVKDQGGTVNLTIPSNCVNGNILQLKGEVNQPTAKVNWYCMNATDWQLLRAGATVLYEEAVFWNIEQAGKDFINLTVDNTTKFFIGNDGIAYQIDNKVLDVSDKTDILNNSWYNDTQMEKNSENKLGIITSWLLGLFFTKTETNGMLEDINQTITEETNNRVNNDSHITGRVDTLNKTKLENGSGNDVTFGDLTASTMVLDGLPSPYTGSWLDFKYNTGSSHTSYKSEGGWGGFQIYSHAPAAENRVTITGTPYTAAANLINKSWFKIDANYNQVTGTFDNTDLWIDRTETSISSGSQYLIKGTVDGVDKFSINNEGDLTATDGNLDYLKVYRDTPNEYFTEFKVSDSGILWRTGIDRAGAKFGYGIWATDVQLLELHTTGGMAIGRGYAGTSEAPDDGLIVEGNVGIGTTTPTERLEVDGNIFQADNYKHIQGTGKDVSSYFNGSDRIVNAEVGSPNAYWTGFNSYDFDSEIILKNITLENGGKIWDNSTCTFISSPDGSAITEVCNI